MLMLNVTLSPSHQLAVETTLDTIRFTVAPGAYNSTNNMYNPAWVTFDPTQPYAVLNGTAYSRVLGWYDEGTDTSPGDDFYGTYAAQLNGTNNVWIEKIGGSPELNTYFINEDVTGNPGTPYTPIFGTAGSSPKWRWDGYMDHNANAVALTNFVVSNQLFTATYHLYIGDANGNPTPGFGDTTTTWRWMGPSMAVIPSPGILFTNTQVLIYWSANISNLTLVAASSPAAGSWTTVTNTCFVWNGQTAVLLNPSANQQFLRLQYNQ
jgi:hypothetical protein